MDQLDELLAAQIGSVLRGHDDDIPDAVPLPRRTISRIYRRRAVFTAVIIASIMAVILPLTELSGLGHRSSQPARGNDGGSVSSMPGVVVATGRTPDGAEWILSNKPLSDGSPHIYFALDGVSPIDFGIVKERGPSGKITVIHELLKIPGPGQGMAGPMGSISVGQPAVWFGFARSDVVSYIFRQTHGSPVPAPIVPIPVHLPSDVANGMDGYLIFSPGDSTFSGSITALDAQGKAVGNESIGPWQAWSPAATPDERAAQALLQQVLLAPDAGEPGSLSGWTPAVATSIYPALTWNDSPHVVPGQVSIRDATPQHVLFVVGSPAGHAYCLELYATGTPGSTAWHTGTGDVTSGDACRGGWPFPGKPN